MSEPIKASDTPGSASTPKDTDAKSRRKRIILFSLLALTVAVAGGGYYSYWTRVGSRYVSTDDAYTAAEVAVVTAEIDGPVAAVNVVDSQQVKHGEVLIVIDDTDAKLALRQAEAELARAQAQVASATSDLERSGIDLQRRQALVASGSVSGDELTKVINGASDARASLNAARAAVALAQARVDKAKVDLGRTVIRSPIDGVIARRAGAARAARPAVHPARGRRPGQRDVRERQFQGSSAEEGAPGPERRAQVRSLWPQGRLPRSHRGIQRRHRRGLRPDPGAERDRQLDQGGAAAPRAHPSEPG